MRWEIDELDPPFRYHVRSESDPSTKYLVDMDRWAKNGQCGCPDFTFNLVKQLKDGKRDRKNDSYRCKHIKAVMLYLGRKMVDDLLDKYGGQRENKT